MSLSGTLLIAFGLGHALGNLTLFADAQGATFDVYAHALRSNPLLPAIEIGLTALFLTHVVLGLRTALENRRARPVRYKQLNAHGDRTLASTTMIVTGVIMLVFLVVHLLDFRAKVGGVDALAPMVVERLSGPVGAALYFVGVGALGLHLWHAFQSLFQTLGLHHLRYRPLIRTAGWGVAALLALVFWLFPTLCMVQPERWTFGDTETEQQAPHDSGEEGHR